VPWDDLSIVPRMAHALGMRAFLYVSLFDEGWPLRVRQRYAPGSELSWQSEWSRRHPEWLMADRSGRRRQWGVPCLAYPPVRQYFIRRYVRLLKSGRWDGLFVCLRSQSPPPMHADQFGFNPPILREYRRRFGSGLDRGRWRLLMGGYLTGFLRELRSKVAVLAVGAPWGDVLGPPLGNTSLEWRRWQGMLDHFVLGQDSTRCPSRGHPLWPLAGDSGYLQDYRTGAGLPGLAERLDAYEPAYVARQWSNRLLREERRLLRHPNVRGLVFSSFRHDHPEPWAGTAG
jgi:hypothetical protein